MAIAADCKSALLGVRGFESLSSHKMKYHYVYKITNLLNNHFYIGVHNTDDLNDGYMGSGKRLHIAYKKYGIKNFKKDIIIFFNSSDDAFEYEKQIVNESLVDDNNCYNLVNGGRNSWNSSNLVVVKLKNADEYFFVSKEEYNKNKDKYYSTWTGKHHSEETKNKVRKTMTPKASSNSRIWISKNGVTKYLRKEFLNQYLEDGWELGRINYKPRKGKQGSKI